MARALISGNVSGELASIISGGIISNGGITNALLLEAGGFILLEDSSFLLME